MTETLNNLFSGPVLPASVIMIVVLVYWGMVILGALDFEVFDFDFDMDADVDAAPASIGLVVLRFLNIGDVPFMIWLSAFGVSNFAVAGIWDDASYRDSMWMTIQIVIRNGAIGVILAKLMTQPLRGKFDVKEPNRPQDLIGRVGVVTTSEVTDGFGRAEFPAEGAPLILNVRTERGPLVKNDRAVIVDFDADRHLYFVEKAD